MTRKTGNLIDKLYEVTVEELRLLRIMQRCRQQGDIEELLVCLDVIEVQYAKSRNLRYRIQLLAEIMGGPKLSLDN